MTYRPHSPEPCRSCRGACIGPDNCYLMAGREDDEPEDEEDELLNEEEE